MATTRPRLVGLKRCFPRTRTRNLAEMATAAAKGPTQKASVRSSSVSPSDVTSGERYPAGGIRSRRVIAHWAAHAANAMSGGCQGGMSKPSTSIPATRNERRKTICKWRGSLGSTAASDMSAINARTH